MAIMEFVEVAESTCLAPAEIVEAETDPQLNTTKSVKFFEGAYVCFWIQWMPFLPPRSNEPRRAEFRLLA